MRLKGCRYLRLIDGRFLACQILQGDLSYQDAYMDLNGCLENENGMFSPHGHGFLNTSTNVALVGLTLYADMKRNDGIASRSSINLTDFLQAKGMLLVPLNHSVSPEAYDYEILQDIPSSRYWLPYGAHCQ